MSTTDSGVRPGRSGAGLAAVVAVLGLVVAGTVVVGGYRRSATGTLSYPDGAVRALGVAGDAGDIRVRRIQGAAPQVRVTRTVTASLLPPRLVDRLDGAGRLTLGAECPPGPGPCSVSYDIEVADKVEAFRLHSTTGDVSVTFVSGDVEAVADVGTVTLTSVSGRSITATAAGDVRISCLINSVYVGGSSRDGSVALQLAPGPPYQVNTVTEGGPVRVDVARQDHAPFRVFARTAGGAITVTY